MNTNAIIRLARKHVADNAAQEPSARLCLADAIRLQDAGRLADASARALKSLRYSVGITSRVYLRAAPKAPKMSGFFGDGSMPVMDDFRLPGGR